MSIRAILYSSPGVAVQLPPDLQSSAAGITRFLIIQFQSTVGDTIVVLPLPNSTLPLIVTDDARQQIYRMYHIYNRNPYVCIVPSIITAAMLGEFVFRRVPVHPGSSTSNSQPSVVVWWTNFWIPQHCPTKKQWAIGPRAPSVSHILQVPASLVDPLETMLTRGSIVSVITFS